MVESEWVAASLIIGLPGMPSTERAVQIRAKKSSWVTRSVTCRGGRRTEYNIASLPQDARIELALKKSSAPLDSAPAVDKARAVLGDREQAASEASQLKEQALTDYAQLPEATRAIAEGRLEILKFIGSYLRLAGFKGRGTGWSKQGVKKFLFELPNMLDALRSDEAKAIARSGVDYVTLLRWRQRHEEHGVMGLAPRWTPHNRGQSSVPETVQGWAIAMITAKPHIDIRQLHQLAEAHFRAATPHEASLRRWVDRWKKANASTLQFLTNPDLWRQTHMAGVGKADGNVVRLNQRWELDSTPADMLCIDGRYTLLGLIEVYSRRAILLVAPTSKAAWVAALVRRGLLTFGVPEEVKTDNGSDYVALHTVEVFEALDIYQDICPPFSPEKKPHIESFFKTFSHGLLELQSGYIGHSVAERKDVEARRTFAQRLFEKDGAIEMNCTGEDLQRFCDEWTAYYNGSRVHGTLGCTPEEKARTWEGRPVPVVRNERALDVLLYAPAGTRQVSKQEIPLNNRKYCCPGALAPLEGQAVYLNYDPTDMSRVLVRWENPETGKREFVCWAVDPSCPQVDRIEFAARARALQNEYERKQRRQLKKDAKAHGIENATREFFDYHAEKRANVIELPREEGPEHSTQALEEAARAADARDGLWDRSMETPLPSKIQRAKADVIALFAEKPEEEPDPARMNEAARYKHWCALDERIARGEAVSEAAAKWHEVFQRSLTWKNFREMEQELAIK